MSKKIPVEVPSGHKWCFTCSTAKPVHAFHRDKRTEDGRLQKCKSCAGHKVREREAIRRMLEESIAEHEARTAARQAEINAAYMGPEPIRWLAIT